MNSYGAVLDRSAIGTRFEPALAGPLGSAARPIDSTLNRVLACGIGMFLGILTLQTDYIGTPTDFLQRIAPVDMLCIPFMFLLFFRHDMRRIPGPALVYLAAMVISIIPGLLFSPGEHRHVWTGLAALLMAFAYYLLGLNIATSRPLLIALLAGLCVGVFVETVIVLHDAAMPNQWFPDPMDKRVRGTFKANGQLGAYGFCAAGLLLTFGSTLGTPGFRRLCVALGLSSASFVFLASRRTGMLCVFLWAALFLVLARRFAGRPFYKAFLGSFIAVLIGLAAMWPAIEQSFVGQRFMSAMSSLGRDEGFIQDQFKACVDTAGQWFPFGFGVGRGEYIDKADGHEIHNNLLAVLVELGVLGLLGFAGMTILPLLRHAWRGRSREHEFLGALLMSFMLISLIFMGHNTLARDRTFLLFLGIATTVVFLESRGGPSSYFPTPSREHVQ